MISRFLQFLAITIAAAPIPRIGALGHGTGFPLREFSMYNTSMTKQSAALSPLKLHIINNLNESQVFAYVTGRDHAGATKFLTASGTWFYPVTPEGIHPVTIDPALISIPLGSHGEISEIVVPDRLVSGRVWVSLGALQFHTVALKGGSASLVEPSVLDVKNGSSSANWGFMELSHTEDDGIYANISFVDFVGIVMSLVLTLGSGQVQTVLGLPENAAKRMCAAFREQSNLDGGPWGQMCITSGDGQPLRILSPNLHETIHPGATKGYFDTYVSQVWTTYASQDLAIDTQSRAGVVQCRIGDDDQLCCEGDNRGYARPSASDIWSCNTGPFAIRAEDNAIHRAVVPRLCAAFSRSTLLIDGGAIQPSVPSQRYYPRGPANHYSRIVHQYQLDGKGYAFPYDNVSPEKDGDEVAGVVAGRNPQLLQVFVGGRGTD